MTSFGEGSRIMSTGVVGESSYWCSEQMRTRGLETRVEMLGWISPQGSDLEEGGYLEMSLLPVTGCFQ